MSLKIKNLIVTPALALVITILSVTSVSAQVAETSQPNIGVSYECPEENPSIDTYDTSRPSKVWNIASKGKYTISGTSNGKTMYTNYKFKGKTKYTLYIKNNGNTAITVKAKRLTKTYASTKISAGQSATIQFSNIKSTTEFYVAFKAGGDIFKFSGYLL